MKYPTTNQILNAGPIQNNSVFARTIDRRVGGIGEPSLRNAAEILRDEVWTMSELVHTLRHVDDLLRFAEKRNRVLDPLVIVDVCAARDIAAVRIGISIPS